MNRLFLLTALWLLAATGCAGPSIPPLQAGTWVICDFDGSVLREAPILTLKPEQGRVVAGTLHLGGQDAALTLKAVGTAEIPEGLWIHSDLAVNADATLPTCERIDDAEGAHTKLGPETPLGVEKVSVTIDTAIPRPYSDGVALLIIDSGAASRRHIPIRRRSESD